MNTVKLSLVVKGAIIALGVCGLFMCIVWYPFSISLSTMGVVSAKPSLSQSVELWTQLAFYWAVSVPCFIVLIFAWKITGAIKNDEVFSYKVVNIIKKSATLLVIDIVVFLIGNIVFLALGWNDFAICYFIIAVIGLVVVSILFVLSHFVIKAIELKEETEGLI